MKDAGAARCDSPLFWDVTTELLRRGVQVRFRPRGFSMLPLIRDKAPVVLAPIPQAGVEISDIVLTRSAERIIMHRVHGIGTSGGRTSIVTRGDSMPGYDAPIAPAQVVAKVREVNGRRWRVALSALRWRIRIFLRQGLRG